MANIISIFQPSQASLDNEDYEPLLNQMKETVKKNEEKFDENEDSRIVLIDLQDVNEVTGSSAEDIFTEFAEFLRESSDRAFYFCSVNNELDRYFFERLLKRGNREYGEICDNRKDFEERVKEEYS